MNYVTQLGKGRRGIIQLQFNKIVFLVLRRGRGPNLDQISVSKSMNYPLCDVNYLPSQF